MVVIVSCTCQQSFASKSSAGNNYTNNKKHYNSCHLNLLIGRRRFTAKKKEQERGVVNSVLLANSELKSLHSSPSLKSSKSLNSLLYDRFVEVDLVLSLQLQQLATVQVRNFNSKFEPTVLYNYSMNLVQDWIESNKYSSRNNTSSKTSNNGVKANGTVLLLRTVLLLLRMVSLLLTVLLLLYVLLPHTSSTYNHYILLSTNYDMYYFQRVLLCTTTTATYCYYCVLPLLRVLLLSSTATIEYFYYCVLLLLIITEY